MSTTVNGLGSISSAGIGSGLDVNGIVTKLMAIDSQPLTQLQTQATSLNAQMSTFGQLQSLMASLQTASNAATSLTLWNQTTATSSDSSSVTASTGAGTTSGASASAGNYTVAVQNLASRQTVTTATGMPASATLGADTLTITLGTYTEAAPVSGSPASGSPPPATGFAANASRPPVNVAIAATDTLQNIADKINAAGAGVTASIITDASGARLSIQSASTGAANGFQITSATGAATSLACDATSASSAMLRSQTSADANATINGISVKSASNALTNVVSGLTVNLLRPTTTPVDVTVAADSASITTAINNFVTAFNGVATFLHTQTQYDASTKTAGPLQGDSTAISIQSQLRGILNQVSSASSAFGTLNAVGITMQKDGTLAVDATKLSNAEGNLAELRKLMITTGANSASSGFIHRFKVLADAALSYDGTFQSRTNSLNARLKANSDDQAAMQMRLAQTQARLTAQYTALDTQMTTLNGLSAYMTQQLAQYNKSTA